MHESIDDQLQKTRWSALHAASTPLELPEDERGQPEESQLAITPSETLLSGWVLPHATLQLSVYYSMAGAGRLAQCIRLLSTLTR